MSVDLVTFHVDGEPHALRLAAIAGLRRAPRITAIPGTAANLVGITAVRGAIVPVFDLHALLGRSRARTLAWLALARADAPIGLAFDGFERLVRVASEDDAQATVVDLGAILTALERERGEERR